MPLIPVSPIQCAKAPSYVSIAFNRCHLLIALQHTFTDLSRIATNATSYNGNASAYDWVLDEGTVINTNTSDGVAVAMLLTQTNGGTRLSSTRYVHYAKMTTRRM